MDRRNRPLRKRGFEFNTMSTNTICFDIETGPLSAEYLDLITPEFSAPGNYKDEDKIAANIAEQKARWTDRAALSPLTGKVLCIGILHSEGSFHVIDGSGCESALLREFAEYVSANEGKHFVGFNIKSFDVPFLIKRCWRLGASPFLRPGANLRYLDNWTDLRDIWQMGDKQAEGSLDAIAKFFGIGAKTGSGKDFAALWESDREAATAYLQNDLKLTHAVGQRMGVIV